MFRPGHGTAVLLALAATIGLAGCAAGAPEPTPSATAPTMQSPSAAPSPSATVPAEPEYDPAGSARDNLAYFDSVNRALLKAKSTAAGKAIIDNLVAAGFAKKDMQVTPDRTPTGNATDSIEFSVRFGTECLIGQSSRGDYTSLIAPALDNGACLVGKTRPITW